MYSSEPLDTSLWSCSTFSVSQHGSWFDFLVMQEGRFKIWVSFHNYQREAPLSFLRSYSFILVHFCHRLFSVLVIFRRSKHYFKNMIQMRSHFVLSTFAPLISFLQFECQNCWRNEVIKIWLIEMSKLFMVTSAHSSCIDNWTFKVYDS